MKERFFRYALADWPFRLFGPKLDTVGLLKLANGLGVDLDLVSPDRWPLVKASGLQLASVLPDMGDGIAPFVPGFNDPKHDERVYKALSTAAVQGSGAGIDLALTFSGMDTGADRNEQFKAIVEGYTRPRDGGQSLIQQAEGLGITFGMEMLNTEGDEPTWRGHRGYLGNSTPELVERVIKKIPSPNMKLAFDVYMSR
jgi:sugar phosphate isomerase/epimerase